MPRRIRTPHRSGITYSDWHRLQLVTGHDFLGNAFGEGRRFRRGDAERAWWILREEIILAHIDSRPCTRPWAWWELEDHPPRRAANPKPAEARPDAAAPVGGSPDWFATFGPAQWHESQAAYLRRHSLLTRREEEHLEANPHLLQPVHDLDAASR